MPVVRESLIVGATRRGLKPLGQDLGFTVIPVPFENSQRRGNLRAPAESIGAIVRSLSAGDFLRLHTRAFEGVRPFPDFQVCSAPLSSVSITSRLQPPVLPQRVTHRVSCAARLHLWRYRALCSLPQRAHNITRPNNSPDNHPRHPKKCSGHKTPIRSSTIRHRLRSIRRVDKF